MGNASIEICTPQPNYVIVEQIHPKSGLPNFGNTIGPSNLQVFRRVIQVCDSQDVFFEGKRLQGIPSTWQYIQEFLRPGKQITTRPNGQKNFLLTYAGFENIITPLPKIGNLFPEKWTKQYNLGVPPSPFVYGKDPIPAIRLYGKPNVQFVMFGGKEPPIAVGIYKQSTKKLELPAATERESVIKKLIQPKPSR